MVHIFETITLPVPKEFDFAQNLAYLERSSNECLFRTEDGAVYRALMDGRRAAVWRVRQEESGMLLLERLTEAVSISQSGKEEDQGEPDDTVYSTGNHEMPGREEESPDDAALSGSAVDYVREWFDLERDLTPFYALSKSDAMLQESARRFYGLRLLGIPDLFEALCWGIIGQQINLAFAYTLKRRLVERYGRAIMCGGETYWLFPEPETIAGLTVEELEPLRMTARKSEYLIDTAKAVVSGELTKERLLAAGGLKEAERLLVGRRGIGPWTAHYVIMRCLRYPDAFPIDDVGLHNAVKSLTGLDRKPTKQELLDMSRGWADWEAYATFYLWRLLY